MRISIVASAFTWLLLAAPSAVLAFAPRTSNSIAGIGGTTATTSSLFASVVDVNERAERNVGAFDEWAASYGVQRCEGFQLTSEDGLDFSAMTTADLPAGSPVLAVPANMVLTTSKAKAELEAMSSGGVQEAADQLGRIGAATSLPEFYLFVKLLVEYEKGSDSPYFPWLDSLPRLYYNSVSMTDFCYECLPPYVFRLSRQERVKFDNLIDVLQKVDVVSQDVKERKDILKWAFNSVHTRCFGEGPEKMIAPMADMFNHGTETEVELSFDNDGNCNVYATRDVPAGYPLRMSYGTPTNPSVFFATYGFLDETSPASFCKIMNIPPSKEVEDLGYDFSKMLFYKDTGDISEEVWDVVLYSKVLTRDVDVQRQFYQAHVSGDSDTKRAIHDHYMLETATELKTHVDTFLQQLDQLSAKAVGQDINQHPRLPLIMNHNEFVRSTFETVKARLDPMVAELGGGVLA